MKSIIKAYIIILLVLISVNSFGQIKRVVVEESTGTWCASCGFGSIYFEHIAENYPNAIPVAVHTGPGGQDPMAIFSIEVYMLDYFNGSPTFLFDRTDFPNNPSDKPAVSASDNFWAHGLDTLDRYMDMVYDQVPLATVGIEQSYNESTREITVTITGNFIQDATGSFRLNCFILEDSVSGGSEYDQANSNFSGWTDGPSYLQPLIDSPHPIPGYKHNHVLRAALGNPEGITASIPTSVISGSSYSTTFTYTLPAEFDENQISLVGLVQKYGSNKVNDRQIVNANSQHLNIVTGNVSEYNQNFIELSVYPNPITDNSIIEFYLKKSDVVSCDLINSNGQIIKEMFNSYFTQGEYRIDLNRINLDNGLYFLKFNNSESTLVKKIIISK